MNVRAFTARAARGAPPDWLDRSDPFAVAAYRQRNAVLRGAPPRQPDPTQVDVGDDVFKSGGIGVVKGGIGTLGMGGDTRETVRSLVDWVAAQATTPTLMDLIAPDEPRRSGAGDFAARALTKLPRVGPYFMGPTSEQIQRAIEGVTGEFYKPKTTAGEVAQTGGEFAASLLGGKGGAARRVAQWVGSTLGAEGASRLAEALNLPDVAPYAKMAGGLAGGIIPGLVPRRAAPTPPPGGKPAPQMNVVEEATGSPSLPEGRSTRVTPSEQAPVGGGVETSDAISSGIRNPPPAPQRPITDHYPPSEFPKGPPVDAAGNFTHTPERVRLTAQNVVGLKKMGQPDMPLPFAKDEPIIQTITGKPIQYLPEAQMPPGAIGVTTARGRQPTLVRLRDDFLPGDKEMARAHEFSHVIDYAAGKIPITGLEHELGPVYNTLNNKRRTPDGLHADPTAPVITPQKRGYPDAKAPMEYMAEAIRAYRTDPNWFKSVAPQTAKRIREYWNTNPQWAWLLQFNSLAGIAAMNALARASSPTPDQSEPDL